MSSTLTLMLRYSAERRAELATILLLLYFERRTWYLAPGDLAPAVGMKNKSILAELVTWK